MKLLFESQALYNTKKEIIGKKRHKSRMDEAERERKEEFS